MNETTTERTKIFHILQVAGGTFPIGGFSHSFGLETFITYDLVTNGEQLKEFLRTYIKHVLCENEVPILIRAYKSLTEDSWDSVKKLNALALATKLTKESRQACEKSGSALLRVGKELVLNDKINRFYEENKKKGISCQVAYAIILEEMGVSVQDAVAAYFFSNVNTIVQSAVKMFPLGNTEGQRVITDMIPFMENCIYQSFQVDVNKIRNFAPMLEIASMEHEMLESRLYMS